MKELIEKFVESVRETEIGGNEGWPLTGPQIVPYFDVDQALDAYDMVMELDKRGLSAKEIGRLFQTPTMMRYHLTTSMVTGLKVADKLGIRKVSTEDRIRFIKVYLEALESLVVSDPFCLDYKNQIYSGEEANRKVSTLSWIEVDDSNRKIISNFSVDLFYYAWALYYNLYASAGFEVHGPYEVRLNGEEYVLVVRENFNMKPNGIWDIDPGIDSIKLFLLYKKGTEFKLSYYNQPISDAHNKNLLKVAVLIDGKSILNTSLINLYAQKLAIIAEKQTKYINSLGKYEQMLKGAEISFFMLKDLYSYFGKQPEVKKIVEANYKVIGDKSLNSEKQFRERSTDNWVDMFDPRTDSLGDIEV